MTEKNCNYFDNFDPLNETTNIVGNTNWDEVPVTNIEPQPHEDINVDQFTFAYPVEETKEDDLCSRNFYHDLSNGIIYGKHNFDDKSKPKYEGIAIYFLAMQ